jgi:hypothetical protein
MKKIMLILMITTIVMLAGCAEKEPIYEKYKDNSYFLECYDDSYSEFQERKAAGEDLDVPENIEELLTDDVAKEIIANACLTELAMEEKNIEMCKDQYIDRSKKMYDALIEEAGPMGAIMKNVFTTEGMIQQCEENVNEENSYSSQRSRSSEAYWQTADIAIVSNAISASGDSIIKVRNNLRSTITISSVNIDGKEIVSESIVLNPGQTNSISGSFGTGICNLPGDSFAVNMEITYTESETGALYVFTGDGNKLEGTCAE